MKVLFDSEIFELQRAGGISRYFTELTLALSETAGTEAAVVAPFHVNEYLSKAQLPRVGFSFFAPRASQRLRRAVNLCMVEATLAGVRHDILHATYYSRHARPRGAARLVITVHDMIHELFPHCFRPDDPVSALKRRAVASADHIICVSEHTRQDLCRLLAVPAERTSVVHHGVHLNPFEEGGAQVPPGRPYLLFVGQRGGYKNFDLLLRALAEDARLARDVDVVAFGGGGFSSDERLRFQALGLRPDAVRHAGGDDASLSRLYRGAICLVYPSLYEGFGMPVLEAMANDCPVVVSRTSSLPEAAGAAAEYCEPLQPGALTDAIARIVDSSANRARLVALGRERAAAFSWRRTADQTLGVYRSLLGLATAPVQAGVRV